MDFSELVDRVKAATDIDSSDGAAGVTEATLQSFGSYLKRDEKDKLSEEIRSRTLRKSRKGI